MLYPEVAQRLAEVSSQPDSLFAHRRIGLEKESLRVNAEGGISQTDHPRAFGRALTNPKITTDFSEALLEMVTPPCNSAQSALDYLTSIHHYVVRHLPNREMLWNTSMPCILSGESSVRIAEYGHSHNGRMKNIYRRGLGLRYGRKMQAIAGIHFNYSMPEAALKKSASWHQPPPSPSSISAFGQSASMDDATTSYFHMSRNLLRIGWLVPYLFGSSPAVCHSFVTAEEASGLEIFNDTTLYEPTGTSLRQGNIGYSYREDDSIDLSVRHDCFRTYIDDLLSHVTTKHPAYDSLGVVDQHGRYLQLNTNRLQIENEYYSSVRPKQIPQAGEMPLLAMHRRGIQYIELRSLDVSPFHSVGLDLMTLQFLELMMMFSFLADSPPLEVSEMSMNGANMLAVAHRGREAGIALATPTGSRKLKEWAAEILSSMAPIADYLAQTEGDESYQQALKNQQAKLADPTLMPSTQVLDSMRQNGSFYSFAQSSSTQHHQQLLAAESDRELLADIESSVAESEHKFAQMDQQSSDESFARFLADYFSQLDDRGSAA